MSFVQSNAFISAETYGYSKMLAANWYSVSPERKDRLFFAGKHRGCLGVVKAYYDVSTPDFLNYAMDDTIVKYIEDTKAFLEYLKEYFPNKSITKRKCSMEHRLLSRNPIPEYGFRFENTDNKLSVYIKIAKFSEFEIRFYMR